MDVGVGVYGLCLCVHSVSLTIRHTCSVQILSEGS